MTLRCLVKSKPKCEEPFDFLNLMILGKYWPNNKQRIIMNYQFLN